MKLTNEQITSLTFGAVAIEEREDGLHFFKCTKRQIAAWTALSESLGERAEVTTTGVRLDLHTDARELRISGDGRFEVLINGLLRASLTPNGEESVSLALTDPLGAPQDEVRVTLVFPSHGCGILREVELVGATYARPHEFKKKLLFYGDSITQGWKSDWNCLSYAWRVTQFFDAESIIHGVGGGYFHPDLVDRVPLDPDAIVVAFGTNDFGKRETTDELRRYAQGFMDRIAEEYPDKTVFCISPIWRAVQEKPMGSFAECRAVIIDEALAHGFVHVDGLELVPPLPELFTDPNPLHPGDLGFGIYAENLIRVMAREL